MQRREHIESPPTGREMSDNECRCRIREATNARLRVLDAGAPTALDVTYSVSGNTVVLHPSDRSRSDVLRSRRDALLEIDSAATEATPSWRVVVTGPCKPVVPNRNRPSESLADVPPTDGIELRIEFLEGRHEVPEALPPGSVVPAPRRATG